MTHGLLDPKDSLERQNEKLLKITETLMRRVEQASADSGVAYAQFERAAMLEEEVRLRTRDLERTLDLLNLSNAKLAQANAETEAARANLANAIETVQEGFALFDANDTLVMCNSRFGKHMKDVHHLFQPGLTFERYVDLVSSSPFLALPSGETPAQWAQRRMARHQDDHVVFNARMAGDRWLQVSEHRTANGGTVVLQTDVTDMILLERQERERLLDDQARLIRATLDHLDQGVLIFDRAGKLVGWNERCSELLSVPVGRFRIGARFETLFKLLKRQASFTDTQIPGRVLEWTGSATERAPLSFEIGMGTDVTLAAFAAQMPNQGFVFSFTDVSAERHAVKALSLVNETLERRVMERTLELEDALTEAERANASKSRFVAAASHDLLQPLSAAKLYVASLETELQDPEFRERASKAANALLSVEHILEALLDISKLDSGKAETLVSDVPVGVLLKQLQDELAPMAQNKGLDFRVLPTRAVVRTDATFLRRILQNLLSNAIRYTDAGRVLVGARRCNGTIRIEVWDTGPGIPEDRQDDIFAEFHRLNASASPTDGMGLGLAIVERACRLLNHPLLLRSRPGVGSCFSVELPMVRSSAHSAPTATGGGTRAPLQHAIVLLLENDDELRNALTLTLESWGLDVFPVANLAQAQNLLAEVELAPDILVVDYQLDDGTFGTDAIRSLRGAHGPIPACLITADRSAWLPDYCTREGITLLRKPLDRAELRQFLSGASQSCQ
jgi:signal transduction histidine kinase/CheY-like chemotaxis protein